MNSGIISIFTYCKKIEEKIKLNEINESLESIKNKVGNITTEPSCTSIIYGSKRIDALCNLIGEKNLKINNILLESHKKKSNINYYIATKVLNSGGHSKIIGNLIQAKSDEEHCVLLTGVRGKSDKIFFESEICKKNSNLKIIDVPYQNLGKKLTWIQEHLCSVNPKKVYIFNDHNDSVAISSLSKSMNLDCSFYHHADHKICLGVFSENFKHIDVNNSSYFNCKNNLGISNKYVPCTTNDHGFRNISENRNMNLTTCSVGGRNKIEDDYAYDNLKIIINILKLTNGKHVHIGKLSTYGFLKIKYLLFINKLDSEKFKYIKWTDSIWKEFHKERIDLFISPFPIVGGLTLIEALGSGIPIACHKNIYFRNLSGVDILNKESFLWEHDDELYNFIKNISFEELSSMSNLGRIFYDKYYSYNNFLSSLTENKSCHMPDLQNISYNIHKDDYAIFLENRLSLKNYLKRIVHRILSYIISKI